MKFRTKAAVLKKAVNTILAVHDFGESSDDRQACLLTATEAGLQLESAKLGAYCSKHVEGQLLRAGSVGLNAKDLAGMKLKGEVTISADGDAAKFMDGKTAYQWTIDGRAQQEVEEQKAAIVQAKALAKIPIGALKAGATFTTYASELDDYDVQITIEQGRIEYCGIDYYGYGRYEYRDKSVKARKPFNFILGNSILAKVLKEVDKDETVSIGVSDDGSVVQISGAGLKLWHPAIDKKYQNTADMIEMVTGDGVRGCSLKVMRSDLKDAVERAAPVGKKAGNVSMMLAFDKNNQPSIRQFADDGAAVCRFDATDVEAEPGTKVVLKANYLKEFCKVAPATVPLTVESWNKQFLRITVEDKPGLVDYMVAMVVE